MPCSPRSARFAALPVAGSYSLLWMLTELFECRPREAVGLVRELSESVAWSQR